MSQTLANLQDFDMAIRQLPNLAFGELFWRRHLLLWFHKISNRPNNLVFPESETQRWVFLMDSLPPASIQSILIVKRQSLSKYLPLGALPAAVGEVSSNSD